MPETIDLTPTPSEFRNIAEHFRRVVLDEVPAKRRRAVKECLEKIVEIELYLAKLDGAR